MVSFDPSDALLIVDMQNDFADRAGSLSVAGAERVLPVVNRAAENAAASGALVVYSQDWHPASTPHFAKDGGAWPVHCVADSWGAAFVDGLRVVGEERIRKGSNGEDGYSAFTMRDPRSGEEIPTPLADRLSRHGVRRVVVCGLATDYCVKATALDAVRLGFETVVLTDAIAAVEVTPGDGSRAMDEMARSGAQLTSS